MIKVGITGQAGFIGTHLYNTLGLQPDKYTRIPFDDAFFTDINKLEKFVSQCDVIVHLAAMNRHNDPDILYATNIGLVKQLITAMEKIKAKPHVLFSSSSQEERDNLYGKSKRDGRQLLEQWSIKYNARFTGLVIPNVFGPFANPYYNSVIATFCHQLTHNEQPMIEVDAVIKLIYVSELVAVILKKISGINYHKLNDSLFVVPHTSTIKVSELIKKLEGIKIGYFENGIIPNLDNPFDRNLFNTFVCYIDHKNFPLFHLKKYTDNRGSFVELVRLNGGGQISFSTAAPGITRGNHFHTRKAERFTVIKGNALIELRRIGNDEVLSFELDGERPSFVDMPIWFTHNIKNISNEELFTIFWINECFDPNDPDTFFETV